ncbi:MAG: hypothetical protein ACRDMH_05230 [Solirubrobacterales bacterium]
MTPDRRAEIRELLGDLQAAIEDAQNALYDLENAIGELKDPPDALVEAADRIRSTLGAADGSFAELTGRGS